MKNIKPKNLYLLDVFSLTIPFTLMILSALVTKRPIIEQEIKSFTKGEMLTCTQADLTICNYSTIEDFVDALVAELNNQLNYCGGALVDCNSEVNCCTYNTADFTFTSALSSGKNPFFYCTNESCNSFTCLGLIGGGTQHNDLTVANQNEILTRMKNAAAAAKPCGEEAGSNRPIHRYEVYRTPSNTPTGSCSSDGPCYNLSIKLRVTYLCPCTS